MFNLSLKIVLHILIKILHTLITYQLIPKPNNNTYQDIPKTKQDKSHITLFHEYHLVSISNSKNKGLSFYYEFIYYACDIDCMHYYCYYYYLL